MYIPMGGPPSSFGGELGNGTSKLAAVPCLCTIKTSGCFIYSLETFSSSRHGN